MSKENETCKEFVERIWGKCTPKQIEGLLWHCTAFPFVDIDKLEEQLKEVKEQTGGNYEMAMMFAERVMLHFKESRKL